MTSASRARKLRKKRGRKLRAIKHKKLLEFITNIDPIDSPLFALFNQARASTVYHQWITDTLQGVPNAEEGKDFLDLEIEEGVFVRLNRWEPQNRYFGTPEIILPDQPRRSGGDTPTDGTTA